MFKIILQMFNQDCLLWLYYLKYNVDFAHDAEEDGAHGLGVAATLALCSKVKVLVMSRGHRVKYRSW